MAADPQDLERRRVGDEIVERLRGAGVVASRHDSSEDLVRLLDAVEAFEQAVQRAGGDLMVDEPVASGRVVKPDDQAFVLPARGADESATAFIERIAQARRRVTAQGGQP